MHDDPRLPWPIFAFDEFNRKGSNDGERAGARPYSRLIKARQC